MVKEVDVFPIRLTVQNRLSPCALSNEYRNEKGKCDRGICTVLKEIWEE